jgi:hypothetical protein
MANTILALLDEENGFVFASWPKLQKFADWHSFFREAESNEWLACSTCLTKRVNSCVFPTLFGEYSM